MPTETSRLTLCEIIAESRHLSVKKIKSLLLHNGFDHHVSLPEVLDAIGRKKAEENRESRIALAARTEREFEEKKVEQEVAKGAISNGNATIWCDAAENTVIRTVNSYGKKVKFHNGGYRIGILAETDSGEYETRFYNSRCPDQFAGECYAVLKAIELAAECKAKTIVVRNDRIGGFRASTKKGYIGAKYLFVAKKIADENGIDATFEMCTSRENRADSISRSTSN